MSIHDIRCTKGLDIRLISLISGWYPWYPAVGFGRNMAVFSDLQVFYSGHCALISGLYLGISSWYFFLIFWWNMSDIELIDFLLSSFYYIPDIWLINLISWYPVYRFPARCYPLPTPVLGMNVKLREILLWLFLKINIPTALSMKRSQVLSIDMVVHRVIFKNYQITLFPSFTFLPKTGVSFYCVHPAS